MNTSRGLFRVTIFGESHGSYVGVTVDCPPGIPVDMEEMQSVLSLRSPGKSGITSARNEEDIPEIISGVFNGFTTGRPVTIVIKNRDAHSKDYDILKEIPRPGHVDYAAHVKYSGFEDYRGGGSFSGRLTAPLVAAGYIASKYLELRGITAVSFVSSLGDILEKIPSEWFINPNIEDIRKKTYSRSVRSPFDSYIKMQKLVEKVRDEGNSIGGTITTIIDGISPGMGEPFFSSLESELSSMLFSIPGIKGVEFGTGFEGVHMKGSDFNDAYNVSNDAFRTLSNNNGGVAGGISTGMPVIFRCAVRPTSSISKVQETVNYSGEKVEFSLKGRHDPCILIRAVPVIEYSASIVIADMYMRMMANA